jgi:iron complex outermembrane receptor protein
MAPVRPFAASLSWTAPIALLFAGPTAGLAQEQSSTTGKPAEIEEIVVSASKFGRELDRAPVAVTELTAEMFDRDHIRSVQEVQARVPSLVYSNPTNFAQAYIRGIGSNFSLAGLESAVAFYQDGVYLQRQAGATLDVVDLAAVQVLKGPQGTLYGRNATGGAILIQTADPTNEFEGKAALEYGRFDHVRAEGMINLPISDTLAVRFAGQRIWDDGYINDTVGDRDLGTVDSHLVRGKIRWQATPELTAIYSIEHSKQASNLYAQHQRLDGLLCMACTIYGVSPARGFYDSTQGYDPRNKVNYWAHTLRIDYEGEQFTVTSVTGYRDTHTKEFNEQDSMGPELLDAYVTEKGPTFTQDIYARTTFDSPLNFLVGGSYERDRNTLTSLLFGDQFGPLWSVSTTNKVSLDSYSVYAEAYYDLTSSLKLTVGGRYNVDDKKLRVANDANAALVFGTPGFEVSDKFKDLTPRIVLSYDAGDRGYYYVSYNRGAKSGGFSTPALTPPNALESEILDSFEIGAKNSFLDGTLTTSAAIFYGKYKDVQVQRVDALAGTVAAENAAEAEPYGAELDVQWEPIADLNIGFGATYLHNEFTKYEDAAVFIPNPQTDPACAPFCPGLVNGVEDLSDTRLPRSPKYSAYLSITYSFPVVAEWKLIPSAIARYSDDYDFLAGAGGPLRLDRQDSFTKVDATLTLSSPDDRTQIGAYVGNLTGEKYFDYAASSVFGAFYTPAAPRTYGVRVAQKF